MSENVTSNLRRMSSKDKMIKIGTKLVDSNYIKYIISENESLKEEILLLKKQIEELKNESKKLAKVVDTNNVRVMAIEEEKGITIGELKVLLEDLSVEKKKIENKLREEKNLLSHNLKQMIDKLTQENENLKKQIRSQVQPN